MEFNQLCVWHGTTLGDSTGKDFEAFVMDVLLCKAKFCEEVTTLPFPEKNEEGGRIDLFFYVADEDVPKFAVPRLTYGIRWWEDVLGNCNAYQYPDEILERYPATW